MSKALFSDNLYGSEQLRHLGGCGLFGCCDSWYFERHGRECKPGMWRVGVMGGSPNGFSELLFLHANAVVDDFGSLVKVGEVA